MVGRELAELALHRHGTLTATQRAFGGGLVSGCMGTDNVQE